MDTRELELFVVLAETLHFGQAAERMHLSSSAISRTIKRMEDEVGQRLLERDKRSGMDSWTVCSRTISRCTAKSASIVR
jgi:DNA-binding transcriptional LysR family regulator